MRAQSIAVLIAAAMTAGGSAGAQTSNQAEQLASLLHNIAPPPQVVAALSPSDAKYDSPACREARALAETYEDKTRQRAAVAIGASVILALVGSPVLVAPSPAAEGMRRMRINQALVQRCVSNTEQVDAALAELKKRAEIEAQDRTARTTRYEPIQ